MMQNIATLDGLVPDRLAPRTRKIVLEGYDLSVDIGFHDFEIGTPPAYGIYAGSAGGHLAAISIGTNPHYGGGERRIEAFLLDFDGDLYGQRLVVELWHRIRDERAFASEAELVEQIARDVEETRRAERP